MKININDLYPSKFILPWSSVHKHKADYKDDPDLMEPPTVALVDGCWLVTSGNSRIFAAKKVLEEKASASKSGDAVLEVEVSQAQPERLDQIASLKKILKKAKEKGSKGFNGVEECEEPKGSHRSIVIAIFALSVIFDGLIMYGLRYTDITEDRYRFSLYFLGVLLSFWVVYFAGRILRIGTLREFLDAKTYRLQSLDEREVLDHDTIELRQKAISDRSLAAIVSQGTFLGAVALLLGGILDSGKTLNPYQLLMQPIITGFGLISVLLLLWSVGFVA